jgi:UDP-glucuronate 4-epimerase
MNILVTGAAGFIGSHVAERLSNDGHYVVGMDNFDPFYARSAKERNLDWTAGKFDFFEGDIMGSSWEVANLDCIVHMAAKAGVASSLKNPVAYQRTNVVGTQMVMKFAQDYSIKKVILASSSSIYGNCNPLTCSEGQAPMPISPYAASKVGMEAIGEATARLNSDMSVVALRFFTAYGPRMRPDLAIYKFAELMSSGEKVEIFGEGTSRDYTYIDDVVEGIVSAIELDTTGFHTCNIGGGHSVSPLQIIDTLARALGVTPKVDTTEMRDGDVTRTLADVRRAKSMLGWEPKTSLEEGLGSFVSWFRQNRLHLDGQQ